MPCLEPLEGLLVLAVIELALAMPSLEQPTLHRVPVIGIEVVGHARTTVAQTHPAAPGNTQQSAAYTRTGSRMLKRLALLSGPLLLVAAATGCGPHEIRVQSAAELPPAETAAIRIAPGLVLDAIDGDHDHRGKSTTQRPLTVILPPGKHTLTLHFRQDTGSDQPLMNTFTTTESGPVDVELNALAGRVYAIDYDDYGDNWQPRLREVESDP